MANSKGLSTPKIGAMLWKKSLTGDLLPSSADNALLLPKIAIYADFRAVKIRYSVRFSLNN